MAVAVHPDDTRYRHLLDRHAKLRHPFRKDTIPLVADSNGVDPALGTGAVKITPHHDQNDFEIGKRHELPGLTILDEKGSICFPSSQTRFQLTEEGESFVVSGR